jgi:hypothetical protein
MNARRLCCRTTSEMLIPFLGPARVSLRTHQNGTPISCQSSSMAGGRFRRDPYDCGRRSVGPRGSRTNRRAGGWRHNVRRPCIRNEKENGGEANEGGRSNREHPPPSAKRGQRPQLGKLRAEALCIRSQ